MFVSGECAALGLESDDSRCYQGDRRIREVPEHHFEPSLARNDIRIEESDKVCCGASQSGVPCCSGPA